MSTQFKLVDEGDVPDGVAPAARPAVAAPSHAQMQAQAQQATRLLMLAIKALSERAVIALGNLFSLVLAGSVWWLAWQVLSAPTDRQLIGLGLYAVFVLALHAVRKKV